MAVPTDFYNLLFGKVAIQDGNVIDMAEHGRIGGVSTGKGFKNVQILDVSGNPISGLGGGTINTGNSVDNAPATQNITVIDSSSTSAAGANNQSVVIGTPTAGSAASFTLAGYATVRVEVTGIWTGTLSSEISIDSGTTWVSLGLHQGAYTTSTFTAGFIGGGNVAGATNYRIRATAAITGTATVKVIQSVNTQSVYIANAAPSGNVISTLNSSTSTLTSGSVYTGTAEDVSNFAEIRVSLIANVASATDGLSIQQSSDSTNWDIIDTYTIPANSGKTFVVPRQARYTRIVYTNGGTNQGSFRLQTILNRVGSASSSQRAQDAYSNENDFEQVWSFNSMWNGTTWDRIKGNTTNGQQIYSGTGALDLGKAEDAAHTSGDTGIFALGIVNASMATLTNTDMDYSGMALDPFGRVNVVQKSLNAMTTMVSASAVSVTLLAANNLRNSASVYNNSSAILYLKHGIGASVSSFKVPLAASTYYEIPGGYTGRIDGVWASAAGSAAISEET